MSAIRAHGNRSTELALATAMRKERITGWRRHQQLAGKPDFVFRRHRVVVFVDGCFWHGCPKCYRPPSKNSDYWLNKIAGNKARDLRVARELRRAGWRVFRIWEHSLASNMPRVLWRLRKSLATAAMGSSCEE